MGYTYLERKEYELKRRVDLASQEAFFSGAMKRMQTDDNIRDLVSDHEFACDVLFTCGFCSRKGRPCDRCALDAKFEIAKQEIQAGKRIAYNSESYWGIAR